MPAYNFQKWIAEKIRNNEAHCTIRRKRKRPTKAGDKLIIYTAQRTKQCEKIGERKCKEVSDIVIDRFSVWVGGRQLDLAQLETLASEDGFACIKDFLSFFKERYGLPFTGVLIRW
jgi:hypothetical protein